MKKGLYQYLLILAFFYGLWYLCLGYFPFLICLLLVIIFIFNILLSYKGMTSATIESNIKQSVIKRHEKLQIIFRRKISTMFPIGNIVIEYHIFNAFHQCIDHQKVVIKAEEYILEINAKHSGYYYLKIDNIYCYDILQCLYKKHSCHDMLDYYVFPVFYKTPILLQEALGKHDESIKYSPSLSGDDYSEIFDLRSYREQDSLRHIHWKASLKQGEMLVKIGSQPVIKKILIAVDINNMDSMNDACLDHFYSLCLSLIHCQIAFEVLCPQNNSELMKAEFITNDDCLRECMKHILQIPKCSIQDIFYHQRDLSSIYIVKKDGIEVLEK